jgi:hypothetical protein
MIPHEKELVERLKNKPFALVGINTDKDKEYYKRQVAELGVTWRSSWQGGTNGPLCLDHKGVIRFKDVRGKQLDAAVDKLLQELEAESGEPPAK